MELLLFPGQGSQFKGMGGALWSAYPELTEKASRILGYSIRELCLEDPHHHLNQTQFTQPALYVVGALHFQQWLEKTGKRPEAAAGHSLGEYPALFAAGVFDFENGLRLVQKRGQLMSEARDGSMAAVIGMPPDTLRRFLQDNGLDGIDLANLNSVSQTVLAGDTASITRAEQLLTARDVKCVVLNVSAAFHSRHMEKARQSFATFLQDFTFASPAFPVISNVTARPHQPGKIAQLLAEQITSPVRWSEGIRYLMGLAELNCTEMGADPNRLGGMVLTKLTEEIQRTETPLQDESVQPHPEKPAQVADARNAPGKTAAQHLGNPEFLRRYGLKYAYVAGAMYRGVASAQLVVSMARAGMIGFFGSGGLPLEHIEKAIVSIRNELQADQPFGCNLLANLDDPTAERRLIELYLKHGVRHVEAAAYMQVTPALALFRIRGLQRDSAGKVRCNHHVLAKVSRLEVAEAFMSPVPDHIIQSLLAEGAITADQADMARQVPVSHEVCVEADSGGHTDGGIPTILLPAMLELRDQVSARHGYHTPILMGMGGGIGTPTAAAAIFCMGADFIVTGSINQCTVESGATDIVKDLLQDITIHDTAYAPAGDMFEFGARVQVLKKGVLFPMRANRLHALYSQYASLEDIPEAERSKLEKSVFKRSLDEVWQDALNYLRSKGREQDIRKAMDNPKIRMARVFRWYFGYSTQLCFSQSKEDLVNYQVHTGPALGAFNHWVKGSELESWRKRHVDAIAIRLLEETARLLERTANSIMLSQ